MSTMQTAYRQAYNILRCATPKASIYQEPVLNLDQEPHCLRLDKHINHLGAIAAKFNLGPDRDLASLLYDAGFLIWLRQINPNEGIPLLNRALKSLPSPGDVQDNLLRSHIYLTAGRIYHTMGPNSQIKSAKLCNLALVLRQKIYECLGPYNRSLSHRIWLFCARVDVAMARLQEGAIESAGSLFEECRNDYSTWSEEQEMPFDSANMYHGLAECHFAHGDLESAVRCAQDGKAAVERSMAGDSAYCHLFPHACFLQRLGKRDEALALHERVLEARGRYYGEQGLPTLESGRAIAALRDGD